MIRILSLTIVALAAVLLVAGTASAKGPFKAEISGGNLDEPVLLDETFPPDAMNSTDVKAPASLPDQTYTLRLIFADENGELLDEFATFTYVPEHEGNPPLLRRPDGMYTTVSKSLSQAIEAARPSGQLTAPVQEDGGTTVAWWVIPSAIGVGLFLLGGGIAGSRLLKKREAAAA